MKCWECKKKISSAIRVCYLEYHEEAGGSKEKFRDVCFVEVKKITGRQIKKEIKDKKKNPYLKNNGSLDLIEKFPGYKKEKLKIDRKRKKG